MYFLIGQVIIKVLDLLEYVFKNSSNSSFHFLDPADIDNRKNEFKEMLLHNIDNIDTLSINENECNSLFKAFDLNETYITTILVVYK